MKLTCFSPLVTSLFAPPFPKKNHPQLPQEPFLTAFEHSQQPQKPYMVHLKPNLLAPKPTLQPPKPILLPPKPDQLL